MTEHQDNTVETHDLEFSIQLSRERLVRICTKNGLTVDPTFGYTNGGVTRCLRVTGERELLRRLVRRFGYPGQNPDLE
jgi:hypothetical protein